MMKSSSGIIRSVSVTACPAPRDRGGSFRCGVERRVSVEPGTWSESATCVLQGPSVPDGLEAPQRSVEDACVQLPDPTEQYTIPLASHPDLASDGLGPRYCRHLGDARFLSCSCWTNLSNTRARAAGAVDERTRQETRHASNIACRVQEVRVGSEGMTRSCEPPLQQRRARRDDEERQPDGERQAAVPRSVGRADALQ